MQHCAQLCAAGNVPGGVRSVGRVGKAGLQSQDHNHDHTDVNTWGHVRVRAQKDWLNQMRPTWHLRLVVQDSDYSYILRCGA